MFLSLSCLSRRVDSFDFVVETFYLLHSKNMYAPCDANIHILKLFFSYHVLAIVMSVYMAVFQVCWPVSISAR